VENQANIYRQKKQRNIRNEKMKNLIKLFGILIILLVFAIYLKQSRERIPQKALIPKFDTQKASGIEIKTKNTDLELVKKDDTWMVEKPVQAKADINAVNELLDKLKAVNIGEVITDDKSKYHDYEVTEESGTVMTVSFKDKKPISIIFGKQGSSYQSIFLRYSDKKQVYLSFGMEKYILEKELKLWRDRQILKFKNDDIVSVAFQKKDGFEVIKSSEQWLINTGKKQHGAESIKVIEILNQLNNLIADDFYTVDSTTAIRITGLNEPVLKVIIKFNNNEEKEILFGKKDSQSRVYVSYKDMDPIYLIYEYTFTAINKKYSELTKQQEKK